MTATILKIIRRLSRADIIFYLMPPLMVLLVVGTVAQKEMGLYAAQHLFFSSFFLWIGGVIPVPVGYSIMGALTLCLALKFIFHSTWEWTKSGIILSHLGALILLGGGWITALNAKEGYIALPEGQSTSYVYDYHQRSLFIFEDELLRYEMPAQHLKTGVQNLTLPFTLDILESCTNCEITNAPTQTEIPRRAMAAFMQLSAKPSEKEPENNLTGATFMLGNINPEIDGLYIAFENMPKPITLDVNGKNYKIIMGRAQRLLPFTITLEDFIRTTYPGTDKPSAYSSDVIISDGDQTWPVRIEMNKPLRYKGYTFYQSSFEQTPEIETTILSVVENKGRLFPYIGTITITLGLLLHLILMTRRRR